MPSPTPRCLPIGLFLAALAACSSTTGGHAFEAVPASQRAAEEYPGIYSIGTSSILVFQSGKDLIIPITGIHFSDDTLIWTVSITGVSPLVEGEDYRIEQPPGFNSHGDIGGGPGARRSNLINIVLAADYVATLRTQDRLNISVSISDGTELLARMAVLESLGASDASRPLRRVRGADDTERREARDDVLALRRALTTELNRWDSSEDEVTALLSALLDVFDRNLASLRRMSFGSDGLDELRELARLQVRAQDFLTRRVAIPRRLGDQDAVTEAVVEDALRAISAALVEQRAELDHQVTAGPPGGSEQDRAHGLQVRRELMKTVYAEQQKIVEVLAGTRRRLSSEALAVRDEALSAASDELDGDLEGVMKNLETLSDSLLGGGPESSSPTDAFYAVQRSTDQMLRSFEGLRLRLDSRARSGSARAFGGRVEQASASDDVLDSWSELEATLQEIARMQRSLIAERDARVIRPPILSSATREFVFYSVEDYRNKVVSTRVPIHDISAYPLPADETAKLFGSLVADLYFVVRLSIRNTDSEDRLVSTGMIKATGRALVNHAPEPDAERTLPTYSVPVEIVPQSREHVYTIVANGRKDETRDIVFRSLEFTGALASAYVSAFDVAADVAKALTIGTGIAIPQAQKLWPDQVPEHLSNIVNYTMPDLIKVPKKSVIGHRYLFFSKGDLQGVVSDPEYAKRLLEAPDSDGPKVVYLAFDALDIPYEVIAPGGAADPDALVEARPPGAQDEAPLATNAAPNTADRRVALLETVDLLADRSRALFAAWAPDGEGEPGWTLDFETWLETRDALRALDASNVRPGAARLPYGPYAAAIETLIDDWRALAEALDPEAMRVRLAPEGPLAAIRDRLVGLEAAIAPRGLDVAGANALDGIAAQLDALDAEYVLLAAIAEDFAATDRAVELRDLVDANVDGLAEQVGALTSALELLLVGRAGTPLFADLELPELP